VMLRRIQRASRMTPTPCIWMAGCCSGDGEAVVFTGTM
jgi:hypothetical protein